MSQNIGTLITAPIRPNDSLDPIAVAFGNEIKGGHHAYATLDERNSIIDARRDWGMLVTIYNDGTASNNKTYQLSFSYSSSSLLDNNNWVAFSSGDAGGNEWLNSVISRTSSIPLSNNNSDRYLIIGTPSGTQSITPNATWSGYVDAIAEYNANIASWDFTFPNEGSTLRVDNEINTLYKYTGIYGSGGSWNAENINQVFFITATSSDGSDYTAYANITSYSSPSVFYANFATSSIGSSASLNINGLGKVTIKKSSGNQLTDIGLNDLNTTIQYQLIYDGTLFQTPLSSAVNQIGPAEQVGGYLNGLYTDFNTTTPIGTPIDRFNQVLKSLVPPTAPELKSWNGTFSVVGAGLNTGVGKLSFPSIGVIDYNQATASPYGNVFLNQEWGYGATADGGLYRLGIISNTTSNPFCVDLFGTLNYNVATQGNIPTPAYDAGAFGYATTGYLIMKINGLTVSTVSLTNSLNATNSTNNFTTPGFSVSTATSSKFPAGDPFDVYYNRTGNWYLPKSCLFSPFTYTASIGLTANQFGVTRGYNSITINHNRNNVDNILSRIEFVLDDSSSKPSYVNIQGSPVFGSPTINATKSLSGITYITNLTLFYQTNISDIYKNTYSPSASAIQWSENFILGNSLPNTMTSIIPTNQIINVTLPDITFDISTPLAQTKNINITSITAPSKRRIGDTMSVYISTLLHPINSITFSAINPQRADLNGVVLDTFTVSSTYNITPQLEDFDDEANRIRSIGYTTLAIVISATWSSNSSLTVAPYDNELQVYNGRLYYPILNWSSYGSAISNPNFGIAATNYSGIVNPRRYYRRFYLDTSIQTSKKFTLNLQGSATVVSSTVTSFTDEIKIFAQLPGKTGLCDVLKPYTTDAALLSGGGCYDGTPITTLSVTNSNINLNFGAYGTADSSGFIIISIQSCPGWTGYLDSMQLTWN